MEFDCNHEVDVPLRQSRRSCSKGDRQIRLGSRAPAWTPGVLVQIYKDEVDFELIRSDSPLH